MLWKYNEYNISIIKKNATLLKKWHIIISLNTWARKLTEVVWANFALCSNCGWGSQAQYYPHSYKWSKEGLGPIPRAKANEGPRTTIRGMDKITIRGELEHAGEELGHVRGRWSPRDFCPRYLVNLLITQNNAWDKSYNRAKGEISNKK